MTRTTMPWFETLTDSVTALGAAALEAQRAWQAAQITTHHYDCLRVRPLEGTVTDPGRHQGLPPVHPYEGMIAVLETFHMTHEHGLRKVFITAALSYGYGAAWAIQQVIEGHQPEAVELTVRGPGCFVIPDGLVPVPPAMPSLDGWPGAKRFEQARQRMETADVAGEYAADLADEDYLADHEASAMHDAETAASDLPDAAFAYGQLAESALRYALLDTRHKHGR
ncbi:hypothetical protein ACFY04_41330 [Streptomyces sp. NPDC001549]|uniref:hypothetical protein n=1 Tax=Streptomyces sp. NPDC001549 TaxID=3364586 RepID=UPI003683D8B8